MTKLFLFFFISLHRLSYKMISFLVIRENNGLHPKHRILNYHKFFLDNISTENRVLDIGCGNGALAFDLAEKARLVVGIESESKYLKAAKQKYRRSNLHYIHGDATTYNFSEQFDVVTLSNVLEHIENRIDFLKKIQALASTFLIRVPLLTRDWLAVYEKENGYEYRLDLTHFTEYSEESFQEEMAEAGLRIRDMKIRYGEIYAIIDNHPL